MPTSPPILDYASPPVVAKVEFPTFVRLVVLLFIVPALAMPFVTFGGTSPLNTVADFFQMSYDCLKTDLKAFSEMATGWGVFGLNIFVGIPLVLCHLRVLIFGKLSRIESWAGYVVAILGTAPAVMVMSSLVIRFLYASKHAHLYAFFRKMLLWSVGFLVVYAVVIAFGAVVVWFLGRRVSHGTRICACLCIPYMAGLLALALCFVDSPYPCGSSYLLLLSVIVGCLIEIATLAVMAFRRGER
ncbi:MAG: hypothetical protein FWD53_10950 [Phycisphaerales bacterium]|nr:hypothetical protein [Phycisphaerales bacterium]